MAHAHRILVAGAGLLAVMLVGKAANGADQGLTGKKLLLKSVPKVVVISKDASISIAGSDPINGADSSVSFDAGGGPVTLTLPKALWSTNGAGTLFKYKNADAPGGPSVVKIAKVKPGLLKVVAKGLPFAVPNGAATIDVVLSLDGGTNSYCMTFSGTGDGAKFLVKDALAGNCGPPGPTATPTPTSTSTPTLTPTTGPCAGGGDLVGGFCWFPGGAGASCNSVCGAMGMTCDPATEAYAGSGGTEANCQAVVDAVYGTGINVVDSDCTSPFDFSDVGCVLGITGGSNIAAQRCTGSTTTCSAAGINIPGVAEQYRLCACE
jgi:hypothetical protein